MLRVHSIQSLGAVDGPGVRFVVFAQGCPLRCACCHNPDTWDISGGREMSAAELARKCARYKEYFGDKGGITVSGGEPLLQAKKVSELFALCKEQGINTCLDTSGCIISEDVLALLDVTDRVLLDIKYTNDADYQANVGCSLGRVLEFLALLDKKSIPTTLRQVIIPTLNDSADNMARLKAIKDTHPCVDSVELLPFRKICESKYRNMGIPFPLAHLPEATKAKTEELKALL